MVNLERILHTIVSIMFKEKEMDEIKRAKIEYGLSLVLGVSIEFIIVLFISLVFKTTLYTGGARCSSYDRRYCIL